MGFPRGCPILVLAGEAEVLTSATEEKKKSRELESSVARRLQNRFNTQSLMLGFSADIVCP
jgi:hypothetical protein